jgi:FtsP/CotA-like multicopper oxidase with cupredoxin domain
MFVNGIAWPQQVVPNRKIRLRLLNGSNARVLRLRLLKASDFWRLHREGIDDPGTGEDDPVVIGGRAERYENLAQPFLRIGKDTWLWPEAQRRTSMVLTMANRGDIVVDFKQLVGRDLGPGEEEEFILVNTMPQADGRGPKQKLDDAGDPRVLPLPFDVDLPDRQIRLAESKRPIGLMKIIVRGPRVARDATVEHGTPLQPHQRILDREVTVVREFIFERGKGAWQINGRFYDPNINNATPTIDTTEEWVLRNGGGGWWHPIHIHLEAHQLVRYEKDFDADGLIEVVPGGLPLGNLIDVTNQIQGNDLAGLHDTIALGPNSVARIRMRFRTWRGPFVFHCHNIEHEDMRMMFNFEPVAEALPPNNLLDPNIAPNARTHGNDVTLNNRTGELPFEQLPVPPEHAEDVGNLMIPSRPRPKPRNP